MGLPFTLHLSLLRDWLSYVNRAKNACCMYKNISSQLGISWFRLRTQVQWRRCLKKNHNHVTENISYNPNRWLSTKTLEFTMYLFIFVLLFFFCCPFFFLNSILWWKINNYALYMHITWLFWEFPERDLDPALLRTLAFPGLGMARWFGYRWIGGLLKIGNDVIPRLTTLRKRESK